MRVDQRNNLKRQTEASSRSFGLMELTLGLKRYWDRLGLKFELRDLSSISGPDTLFNEAYSDSGGPWLKHGELSYDLNQKLNFRASYAPIETGFAGLFGFEQWRDDPQSVGQLIFDYQLSEKIPIRLTLADLRNLEDEDFHYLKSNQFQNEFLHNDFLNLENLDFILFHYDEKWEIENYSKLFKKASSLTDITIDHKVFVNFLSNLSKRTSKKIIITTGTIDTKIIKELKSSSIKINKFLYEIDLNDSKGYLLINENFFSISHLISKSSLFISCHGAFTHIASNYKIKILDIIERRDNLILNIRFGFCKKHSKRLYGTLRI